MAKDGIFFQKLAAVHPRFHTPAVAIIALGVWSAVMSLMGAFQELISYTMFVAWIFYGLGAATIFVYRRKFPDLPRPYRVPGYPWTPLLFVIVAFCLVINVIVSVPKQAMLGLGFVAVGIPAYFVWASKRRNSEARDITSRRLQV
jgi:APA family basic amino acid/polyamine antiporter